MGRLRGLRTRIVLALGGILFFFAAMAAALLMVEERRDLLHGMERNGRLFARYATEHLYDSYATAFIFEGDGSRQALAARLAEVMSINPDLSAVALTDPEGQLLFQAENGQVVGTLTADPELSSWVRALLASQGDDSVPDSREVKVNGRPTLRVLRIYDPGGLVLAVAVYDLSMASLEAHLRGMWVGVLAWTLLFFVLLGAALSLIVSRAVLRPVTLLSSAAQALGRGFLDVRVSLPAGSAEMRVLGEAFDSMARDLKGTVAKLSGLGDQVSSASAVIMDLGHEMTSTTSRQVAETRRTGEGLQRMTMASREVSSRAEKASQLNEGVQQSLEEMTVSTEEIARSAGALNECVDRTHDSVLEINARTGDLGKSAEALQKLANDAASSITEMLASIDRVRADAKRSQQHADSAHQEAVSIGTATVEEALAGVDRLREIVDRAVGIIEKLSQRSAEVGRITTFIDEVTARTNLLGINASIMAAQAGEHGAGFAVVADEIKSLSIQIAGSTRDMSRRLDSMGQEAASAVQVIREGSASAAESVRLSAGLRSALSKIVEHSAETGRMLAAITETTENQSAGTDRLRQMAEQVTAMARETVAATRSQKAFSARIIDAADSMRSLAEQVTRSTQEHSLNARQVAAAMGELGQGINTIATAAQEQLQEVEPVDAALATILASARENRERATTMSETLTSLSARADTLRAELSRFRFRGSPGEITTPVVDQMASDDGEGDAAATTPAVEGRIAG
ncbi:MAG: methyl-accepting chemotaxis protein, partial [Acidobacteria bacterium]|nr:methyl-accepting chemotaxis protein [Acidobacteriota bacterium]